MPSSPGSTIPDSQGSGDPDIDVLLSIVAMLHKERIDRKLTLRKLSARMGYSSAHLSRAENGISQPGLVVLMRWCRALDLRFIDLWIRVTGETPSK